LFYALPIIVSNYDILAIEQAYVETREHLDIAFSFRPDLIARDKQTGEVVVFNWKTTSRVDERTKEEFKDNLQNFLEHYYAGKLSTEEA
jgi:hypothetical protein